MVGLDKSYYNFGKDCELNGSERLAYVCFVGTVPIGTVPYGAGSLVNIGANGKIVEDELVLKPEQPGGGGAGRRVGSGRLLARETKPEEYPLNKLPRQVPSFLSLFFVICLLVLCLLVFECIGVAFLPYIGQSSDPVHCQNRGKKIPTRYPFKINL